MTTQPNADGWQLGAPDYAINKRLPGASFETVLERVTAALKQQGFGVLTEIDVQKTMKDKLDAELPKYRILGACNPPIALEALSKEPGVGALLPCNVVVAEEKDGVYVGTIDPVALFSVVDRPDVQPLAVEVRKRLEAALSEL
jgi:uncharacterized protein (DUF302 family)